MALDCFSGPRDRAQSQFPKDYTTVYLNCCCLVPLAMPDLRAPSCSDLSEHSALVVRNWRTVAGYTTFSDASCTAGCTCKSEECTGRRPPRPAVCTLLMGQGKVPSSIPYLFLILNWKSAPVATRSGNQFLWINDWQQTILTISGSIHTIALKRM